MADKENETIDGSRRAALTGAAALGLGAATLAVTTGTAAAQSAGDGELAGQVALVTGGARAIGRAIALELARMGADVAILDIADPDAISNIGYELASRADLDEAVALVAETGRKVVPIVADIRSTEALREAAATIESEFGRPADIVAANAAIVPSAPLPEMTEQQWRDVMDVNLTGTGNTIRVFMPGMMERGRGRIIATASTVGRHGSPNNAHYVASKWGVIGLVKSAAIAAGPSGVTVNAVNPTAVDSVRKPTGEALEQANEALAGGYNAMDVAFLEPIEVAHAVAFLASPRANFITGETIDVAAGANARYTA